MLSSLLGPDQEHVCTFWLAERCHHQAELDHGVKGTVHSVILSERLHFWIWDLPLTLGLRYCLCKEETTTRFRHFPGEMKSESRASFFHRREVKFWFLVMVMVREGSSDVRTVWILPSTWMSVFPIWKEEKWWSRKLGWGTQWEIHRNVDKHTAG